MILFTLKSYFVCQNVVHGTNRVYLGEVKNYEKNLMIATVTNNCNTKMKYKNAIETYGSAPSEHS